MAEQVAETSVNLILASPLERARDTARIVAARTGVPVMTEPRLIEQNFGSYEGRDMDDGEYLTRRENLLWRFPGRRVRRPGDPPGLLGAGGREAEVPGPDGAAGDPRLLLPGRPDLLRGCGTGGLLSVLYEQLRPAGI